jgi:hypothetical protein
VAILTPNEATIAIRFRGVAFVFRLQAMKTEIVARVSLGVICKPCSVPTFSAAKADNLASLHCKPGNQY